jgi:lipopolysaccharide transport system permease protein
MQDAVEGETMKETLTALVRHRALTFEMAKRDLAMINKGSILGWAWIALLPLIQTLLYVVIVTYVFRAQPPDGSSMFGYTLYVLGGMVAWQLVSKSLTQAPMLLRDRMDMLKQVVYPIETIPVTALLVSSASTAVVLAVFFVLTAADGALRWSILLLPIPIALTLLMLVGCSWFLSVLGVVLKDLREIVAILLSVLVFLTPVTLHKGMVSSAIWEWMMWNPLTHVVVCFRDTYTAEVHPLSWIVLTAGALVALLVGGAVIRRAKLAIVQLL